MQHRLPASRDARTTSYTCAALVVCALVALLLTACGGAGAATATSGNTGGSADATATVSQPTAPATSASEATVPGASVTSAAPTATSAPAQTAATDGTSASPTGDTLTLRVYFLRDERIASTERVVPHTLQVAAAALDELLKGPSDQDGVSGLTTAIPDGTRYISTAIEGGTATVNLSGEFAAAGDSASGHARLAQVVYTLTQFPTITAVQFALDGQIVDAFGGAGIVLDHAQTRADYEDITPAILVETPAPGGHANTTLRMTGTANTFEATFNAKVTDANGQTLVEQVVTATSGSGTRGTFDTTLTLAPTDASQGTLTVYESSAKDGTPQNVVEIPITFGS